MNFSSESNYPTSSERGGDTLPFKVDREGRPIRIRVFVEQEIVPGIMLTISTSNDRVHIRRVRVAERRALCSFRFAPGAELEILDRAIEMSKTARRPICAGRIETGFGAVIEVGAREGAVMIRLLTQDGVPRGHIVIHGASLASLALAVAEFRKSIAASAASR